MKNVLLSFFVLLLSASLLIAEKKPTVDEVASRLSCYCGTCPHLVVTECGCSTADQIKLDIGKMIDSGMSSDQIVASYVAQYGQTVLSAPPGKGFNLTAWVLPFAAFLAGAGILFAFLKKQKTQPDDPSSGDSTPVTPPEEDDHYQKQLEDELEQRR